MDIINSKDPIILSQFLIYLLNIKHYSSTTVSEYRIDLILFFRFIKDYYNINLKIGEFNVFVLLKVTESDIISFIVYLNYERNCTASTRKRKISSIKAFYKWIFLFYPTGNIKNPAKELPCIQNIKILPKYLTLEQAKKMKNVFNTDNSKFPIRNNTIISLFLDTGLRASELININLLDLDLEDGYIKILGKGNKERIVWINKNTVRQIQQYLNVRQKNNNLDVNEPLFLSYRNDRLNLRTVEKITQNAYKLAGLDGKGYTTHTLRHTTATIIYQYVNSDILILKEMLGHATIKSTEIYTHIHDDKIRKAFESNPLSDYIPSKTA